MKNTVKHKLFKKSKIQLGIGLIVMFFAQTFMSVSYSQTQNVTIQKKNITIREALSVIEKSSKVVFFYADKDVDLNRKVTIEVLNQPLTKVLEEIFKNSINAFKIDGRQVYISKKPKVDEDKSKPVKSIRISGVIIDDKNQTVIGATVMLNGSRTGTITDLNGSFSLEAPENGQLKISYVGYETRVVDINGQLMLKISLDESVKNLDEVVVIGYGTVNKKDATGSVVTLKAPGLNKGLSVLPTDMLIGKIPGLLVIPGDGGPGSGASIRIRGTSSLQASNSPLIVIDGVATSSDANLGTSNVMAFINPNDIESYTVLKDASATAIYGSRASNGVILITTKKGNGNKGIKVDYSSDYSANVNTSQVPVLNSSEFRQYMNEYYPTTSAIGKYAQNMMDYKYPDGSVGQFNTNWQDQIFQVGLTTDQNISLSGGGKKYPYRVSFGYTDQTGTLIGSQFQRYTGSVNFSPKFFTNHLSVDFNVKGMKNQNKNVDSGVISSAASFDPTKPIFAYNTPANDRNDVSNQYGGYYQWLNPDGSINRNGSQNPVSTLLNNSYSGNSAYRVLANVQADYSLHFLPELHLNLNLGLDYTTQDANSGNYPGSYSSFTDAILAPGQGRYSVSDGIRRNKLLDFYLNYQKDVKSIASKFGLMAGYSRQDFYRNDNSSTFSNQTDQNASLLISNSTSPGEYKLRSFYGRFNYTLLDKYLLTATMRADGTSRFSPSNRWGYFPSTALAWRVSEEDFMKSFKNLDNLKVRIGYGTTGQQDIGSDFYPYIPTYNLSLPTSASQYYFGTGDNAQLYQLLSPKAYNENIHWESSTTYNAGIDFSIYKNRFSGSFDYFYKKTTGLLNSIPIPAGSNFTNQITSNIGSMHSNGVELNLNGTPIQTKTFSWNIGFNISWVKTQIDNLTATFNPDYAGIPTGGISMGTGNTIQIQSVGYAPNTFYVYQQAYDEKGYPIQNAFVDQNKDGIIDNKDLVRAHNPFPSTFGGFNMQFQYKGFDLGFNSHFSIDNWVFNDYNSARCSADYTFSNGQTVRNVPSFVYYTSKFSLPISGQQAESSLFLENASFLKLDNITVGYTFHKLFLTKLDARLSFTAQNVGTITNFTGADPEVSGGIANNAWPRPRIFVVGLNVNF